MRSLPAASAVMITQAKLWRPRLPPKTGTLTEGRPRLSEVIAAGGESAQTLLQIAASLEQSSEHPLASAVVTAAKESGLPLLPVEEFQSVTGGGVTGAATGGESL